VTHPLQEMQVSPQGWLFRQYLQQAGFASALEGLTCELKSPINSPRKKAVDALVMEIPRAYGPRATGRTAHTRVVHAHPCDDVGRRGCEPLCARAAASGVSLLGPR
jgi:hypothetical protein